MKPRRGFNWTTQFESKSDCLWLQDPITWKQAYVIFIALATVGLWCANSALDQYVGQMGIVAIIPMVFFFGFGLLNKASPLLSPMQLLLQATFGNSVTSCIYLSREQACKCYPLTCRLPQHLQGREWRKPE